MLNGLSSSTAPPPGDASAPRPEIRIRDLCIAFGAKKVLTGVDLDVAHGSSLVVIGESGSGKSVLLKCILGLLTPDAGVIEIEGRDVLQMRHADREVINRQIGMLFQAGALFDLEGTTPYGWAGWPGVPHVFVERNTTANLSGARRDQDAGMTAPGKRGHAAEVSSCIIPAAASPNASFDRSVTL